MEQAHMSKNIATWVSEVADAFWILQEKRAFVVSDNSANMTLCMDTIEEWDEWPDLQNIRCAGHTLKLGKSQKAETWLKQKQ